MDSSHATKSVPEPVSEDLLQRARAGDDRALDQLFARYLPRLRRWAHGRVPSWARNSIDTGDLRIRQGAFPDIRDVCPDCPPAVAAFFHDALSVVPTRRPTTAADLRASLQSLHRSLTRPTFQPLQ